MARTIVYISLILLSLACNKIEYNGTPKSVSIASLRDIGANNRSELITQNITIEGYVTANDRFGEFTNCIVIEDASAALMLLCEMDDTARRYPFGSLVQLSCSGLYAINAHGAIKIGAAPTGEYTLDYIAATKIGQYLKPLGSHSEPQPTKTTLDQLTTLDIHKFVELSNITITNTEGTATYCQRDTITSRPATTTHQLIDDKGNTARLRVKNTVRYATAELPRTPTSIQAIVEDNYESSFTLRITNYGVGGR